MAEVRTASGRRSARHLTTNQLVERTGQSRRTISKHVEEGLITPAGQCRTPHGNLTNYYAMAEVSSYEAYLVSAGLMARRKRHRVSRANRKSSMLASIKKVGIEAAAEGFGIKVDSLKRNLRNWRKADGEA